jgi:hypothetical protein
VTVCGHERVLTRPNLRYCGKSCRQKAYRDRIKRRLEIAERPAKADKRRELAMTKARVRLEQLRAYLERCRASGLPVPFNREIESAHSEILTLLRPN